VPGDPDQPLWEQLAPFVDWHVPGVRTAIPDHAYYLRNYLQPFTGDELPPLMPPELDQLQRAATRELWDRNRPLAELITSTYSRVTRELRAVQIGIAAAGVITQLAGVLRAGVPTLNPYTEAVDAAEAAYTAMRTTSLQHWPAGLLALSEARTAARAAARTVQVHADDVGMILAHVNTAVREELPALEEIAHDIGVDITGWPDDEEVLTDTLRERFDEQDRHLRTVADLMPKLAQ
jgi:hypothetical protein